MSKNNLPTFVWDRDKNRPGTYLVDPDTTGMHEHKSQTIAEVAKVGSRYITTFRFVKNEN